MKINNSKPFNPTIEGYISRVWKSKPGGEDEELPGGGSKNLVVNTGLNNMNVSSPARLSSHCRVGTGTAAPAATQTDLVSRHGGASDTASDTVLSNSGSAPWWHEVTRTYHFKAGVVSGAPISELGFFDNNSNSSTRMYSRLLIRESDGTPTAISPLADDEILNVSYSIRVNVPSVDTSGTIQINENGTPVNYDYTIRAAKASVANAWNPANNVSSFGLNHKVLESNTLGAIDSQIAGAPDLIIGSLSTYETNSFKNKLSLIVDGDRGNFVTGIGGFNLQRGNFSVFAQIAFTPKIPKDALKTLRMNELVVMPWGTP